MKGPRNVLMKKYIRIYFVVVLIQSYEKGSATDETVGIQRGYAQIRGLVSRQHGRWKRFAKDNVSLCGVQHERPRFKRRNQIKTPNGAKHYQRYQHG